MFDVVEQLKKEWTDKYVVVSSPAPELARFANATGTVKTVNMNGRCLVEFDQYNNIGWYDIDPASLKIVPKPLPKPAESKEKPAKTAAPAKSAAAKPAAAKPAAAKPAAAKPSTADILAAARAKAGGAAPAAAKPAAAKPSTADILAMARAKKAAAESAAPATEEAPAEEAAEAVAEAPAPKAAAPKKAAGGPLPTTTAERIAWCRKHDAKS